jgi:hypothetical protein
VGSEPPRGQRLQQAVVVAVEAGGLVAEVEAVGEAPEDAQHLLEALHLGAVGELPRLAEHADCDALAVDVEADVEHGYLSKSE